MFEAKPDAEVVKKLYALYLRFPDVRGVQDAFFEMFTESSELCKWREYYNKKVIVTYIFENNKSDYLTELHKAASDKRNMKWRLSDSTLSSFVKQCKDEVDGFFDAIDFFWSYLEICNV